MKKTKKPTKKLWMIVLIIIITIGAYFVISALSSSEKEDFDNVVSTGETPTVFSTHEWIISLEITAPEEEPTDEKRAYTPGEIKQIFEENGSTYLTLDMLTMNKDFQPGVTDFFLNESPTIRDLAIAKNAKAFTCGTENIPDISVTVETIIMNIQNILSGGQSSISYYFDIDDNKINTIYEQCLP